MSSKFGAAARRLVVVDCGQIGNLGRRGQLARVEKPMTHARYYKYALAKAERICKKGAKDNNNGL